MRARRAHEEVQERPPGVHRNREFDPYRFLECPRPHHLWERATGQCGRDQNAIRGGGHRARAGRKDRFMPLDSSLVGTTSELLSADVDVAWTMAYAAGLGDALPCYLDTTLESGIVAHPMFSVGIEWRAMIQIIQVLSEAGFPRTEMLRRVHATDDVIVHRPIRPPERLFTRATLAGIERRKAGAYQLTRFDTVDEKGAPVCTTWYGNLYRGVEVSGPDCPPPDAPSIPAPSAGAAAPSRTFRFRFRRSPRISMAPARGWETRSIFIPTWRPRRRPDCRGRSCTAPPRSRWQPRA